MIIGNFTKNPLREQYNRWIQYKKYVGCTVENRVKETNTLGQRLVTNIQKLKLRNVMVMELKR